MLKNSIWTMISLADPASLPGTSIMKVMTSFLDIWPVHYVFLDYVEGAGIYDMFHDREFPILAVSKFLKYLPQVIQFDWGDFYFFKTRDMDEEKILNLEPYEKIALSETTLRAVDDGYIYVYTPYKEVAERVKTCGFKIDSIKEGELTSLDYPF